MHERSEGIVNEWHCLSLCVSEFISISNYGKNMALNSYDGFHY